MLKKILVIGATGMLGKPVAFQLMEDGFQVRILARDIEKARAHFDGSVEIVPGDVADSSSLETALEGSEGVHISVGGEVDQVSAENVAAIAPGLGVQRITYVSGATVCEQNRWFPMVAQKLAAEKAIRACGVPYSIFCPTWPMEQVSRFARDGKAFMLGKQPNPVHFFASRDMARMVSNAYQCAEAANKRLYVYGPEAISLIEALERYCKALHPEVEKVAVMSIWLAKIIATLTNNQTMKFAANLMEYFENAEEIGDATEANQILGAPAITIDDWIEEQKQNVQA